MKTYSDTSPLTIFEKSLDAELLDKALDIRISSGKLAHTRRAADRPRVVWGFAGVLAAGFDLLVFGFRGRD